MTNGSFGILIDLLKAIVKWCCINLKIRKEERPSGIHQHMCSEKLLNKNMVFICVLDHQLKKDSSMTHILVRISSVRVITKASKKQPWKSFHQNKPSLDWFWLKWKHLNYSRAMLSRYQWSITKFQMEVALLLINVELWSIYALDLISQQLLWLKHSELRRIQVPIGWVRLVMTVFKECMVLLSQTRRWWRSTFISKKRQRSVITDKLVKSRIFSISMSYLLVVLSSIQRVPSSIII